MPAAEIIFQMAEFENKKKPQKLQLRQKYFW